MKKIITESLGAVYIHTHVILNRNKRKYKINKNSSKSL